MVKIKLVSHNEKEKIYKKYLRKSKELNGPIIWIKVKGAVFCSMYTDLEKYHLDDIDAYKITRPGKSRIIYGTAYVHSPGCVDLEPQDIHNYPDSWVVKPI